MMNDDDNNNESILPLTLQLFSKVILFILFYKNEDHNYIFSNITKNNVCGQVYF